MPLISLKCKDCYKRKDCQIKETGYSKICSSYRPDKFQEWVASKGYQMFGEMRLQEMCEAYLFSESEHTQLKELLKEAVDIFDADQEHTFSADTYKELQRDFIKKAKEVIG